MSLLLALQAGAVYATALIAAHFGRPAERRAILLTAPTLVLALPALAWAPRWTPPIAERPAQAAVEAVQAIQEPVSSAGLGVVAALPPGVDWVLAAWALGFGVAALRLGLDLRAVHRLRATAHDVHGDVALSDAVHTPMVVGALRPTILLPTDSTTWSASRRAEVLAHERAHIAGRDTLWLLLAHVAACVHWFNPLAWRTITALRDASEHAADEAALAHGTDPVAYAQTLLDVARRAPALGLAMARPTGLEGRIRAALGVRRPGRPGRIVLGVAVLLAVGLAAGTTAPPAIAAGQLSPATTSERVDAVLAAEADRLVATYTPDGVALIVLDPRAGTVLGQLDRGGLLGRKVSPGSVLKPFTVAAALEAGVTPDTPFPDGDMASVLTCSSNPGALAIGERVGAGAVATMLGRVGIPASADIPLDQLVLGKAPLVTPRELARAWLSLGGGGALSPALAAQVRGMLRGVTEAEKGTARGAAVAGVHVAGKTGTSQLVLADGTVDPERMLTTFVGLVPAEAPELLVLVMVAGPHTEEAWGGTVAGPAFANIVRALGR